MLRESSSQLFSKKINKKKTQKFAQYKIFQVQSHFSFVAKLICKVVLLEEIMNKPVPRILEYCVTKLKILSLLNVLFEEITTTKW